MFKKIISITIFSILTQRYGLEQGEAIAAMLTKIAEFYEPAGNDEENVYNIEINEDMSPDDVIKKVMDIV